MSEQPPRSEVASSGSSALLAWQVHHDRGAAFLSRGQLRQAEIAFKEALQLNSGAQESRLGLAAVLTQLKRGDEAAVHYQHLLAAQPNNFAALHDLGVTLRLLQRPAEAVPYFQQAVQVDPAAAEAYHGLAAALSETGRWADAEEAWKRALDLQPNYLDARASVAKVYLEQYRFEEAIEQFRRLLALRPQTATALNDLGVALLGLNRHSEAAVFFRQATRLSPDFLAPHGNLHLALMELGRWREAEAVHGRVFELKSEPGPALYNLATCHFQQGRLREALAASELALAYAPNDYSTHMLRAMALLQAGHYKPGFVEHEWRWRQPNIPKPQYTQPLWDGSDLTGKRILLWCEQGLGDCIQFVRYAALIKARGPLEVICECPPALKQIFSSCAGIDTIVSRDEPEETRPPFDVYISLMSLPHRLGSDLATVPADVPYLSAEKELAAQWRQKLADVPGLRVGIVWQGNPEHKGDHRRSVPLKYFEAFAGLEDVQFFSLQRGFGSEQLTSMQRQWRFDFISQPLDPNLSNAQSMSESAALIANLDLVIAVDTSMAHLAGALGKPVWLLLSTVVDWRWLMHRNDSPWYPAMRLFRQRRIGEWKPVLKRVAVELKKLQLKHDQKRKHLV